MGTSKPSLLKRKIKLIQPNPAIRHLVFQRLRLFYANSAVKTITLMPIAVLEPQSSRTIKTVLISVRRRMVANQSHRGQGLNPELQRAERAAE